MYKICMRVLSPCFKSYLLRVHILVNCDLVHLSLRVLKYASINREHMSSLISKRALRESTGSLYLGSFQVGGQRKKKMADAP